MPPKRAANSSRSSTRPQPPAPPSELSAAAAAQIAQLADEVIAGERRALAKAITLVESVAPEDRARADALLEHFGSRSGQAIRLGISGIPGVGKSTFIEAFGRHLLARGHRPAVLAVDPSSRIGGGSLLADKTRMTELSRDPRAFIRPSPSGGTLGGVARMTGRVMRVLEAAGFDTLIIETVGVGQSETAVTDLVDFMLLLVMPGSGDELQALKKGIVELADLLIVNKADGDLAAAAQRSVADFRAALGIMGGASGKQRSVLACSALTGDGMDAIWAALCALRRDAEADGSWLERRERQAVRRFAHDLEAELLDALHADPAITELRVRVIAALVAGRISEAEAAQIILAAFRGRASPQDLMLRLNDAR